MRFYRTMFTDEGYLTLTLPVRARARWWRRSSGLPFAGGGVHAYGLRAPPRWPCLAITDGDGEHN